MLAHEKKRILVIGGTKFIGPRVVGSLVGRGHEVTVYHRGESEVALPAVVRHVHSPVAGIPVLEFTRELLREHFDVVIHMIAMGEQDSQAALDAFRGRAERIVWISSGDVYRAYGRFTGLEPGPVEEGLLTEHSPLRNVLYPYRSQAKSQGELACFYEKILVERTALSDVQTPGVVLRLPKVYGPENNADLATVYQFRNHPDWRWTHGYVENVAEAIALAATHHAAVGRIYNVGEEYTPTIAQRLAQLPPSHVHSSEQSGNFAQNIAYDTSRIRRQLGYREVVAEMEAMGRMVGSRAA